MSRTLAELRKVKYRLVLKTSKNAMSITVRAVFISSLCAIIVRDKADDCKWRIAGERRRCRRLRTKRFRHRLRRELSAPLFLKTRQHFRVANVHPAAFDL